MFTAVELGELAKDGNSGVATLSVCVGRQLSFFLFTSYEFPWITKIIHQESFDKTQKSTRAFQTGSVPKQNVEAYHSALVKMDRGLNVYGG